ncbi:MAG: tyrosine--tRNA ligase [Kiritimatiellae bacterium]|nr:tyrosine--tRNA ligase [Kiritimatiellia bacterium]
MNAQVAAQLEALASRTVDLVSREELAHRLHTCATEGRPLRIKYGADPSAPDLHLGHVVGLNKLRQFQDLGHTVVFIIGDFTARIGDPSGRSKTRPPLSAQQVAENARTYQAQVFRILREDRTEVRYNSEWLDPLRFDEVIRLAAHVTVAQMLQRDDFGARHAAGRPISLVEFLYPLVQAYDSVMVRADVELGGTDQLFNLLLGRELQTAMGQPPQVVMTMPLLEGLDGHQKMSKSLGNYVGVTDPPGEMFGKIMSLPDHLMWKYWALVMGCPEAEVRARQAEVAAGRRSPRDEKDELARRIVARFHGTAAADAASAEFAKVFTRREPPSEMPAVSLNDEERASGVRLYALLVRAGLAPTNSEARRLILQGAVEVGGERITDPTALVRPPPGCVIRAGRRGFARIDG